MSGAGFILAINLSVSGLFAGAFIVIAAFETRHAAARWFGGSYALGVVFFLLEFAMPLIDEPLLAATASFAVFTAALGVFNVGLARMYDVAVPWRLLAAVLVVAVIVKLAVVDAMARESFARMVLYQAPYVLMQAIGAGIVLAGRRERWYDLVLAGLLAAGSFQFLIKPVLSGAFGGTGSSPQYYLQTLYALISQSMGTVFALAIALMVIVILVGDIVAEIRAHSETDALSGLYNRRGFQDRLRGILKEMATRRLPAALVLCDLDHFKAVNDTYGHATGDRLIALFAGTLRATVPQQGVMGRIGGEEFAVILPGCNRAAARLFAEQAREAYSAASAQGVEGAEDAERFTASFGVTELGADDDWSSLLQRADRALYAAKRGGRDCVRLAPPDASAAEIPGDSREPAVGH